jgi:hypothetical protein
VISLSGNRLFFICRYHGYEVFGFASFTSLSPLAPPETLFAAALFPLYQPVKGQALDYGWCVKSAGRLTSRHAQRSSIISQQQTSMSSYLQTFEAELAAKLDSGTEDTASIVHWVSEKVLESYRNGITAGQKGATVKRQSKSSQTIPPQAQ